MRAGSLDTPKYEKERGDYDVDECDDAGAKPQPPQTTHHAQIVCPAQGLNLFEYGVGWIVEEEVENDVCSLVRAVDLPIVNRKLPSFALRKTVL